MAPVTGLAQLLCGASGCAVRAGTPARRSSGSVAPAHCLTTRRVAARELSLAPPAPAALRRSACRPAAAARRHTVLAGGWGAPVTWHDATLASTQPAADGLRTLVLHVPASVAAGYRTPGQYLQARAWRKAATCGAA
jgi:hypothetical protein